MIMVLFGELDYGTLQPHCGNENDICTQVKLQAVAKFLFMQLFTKNKDRKGCSTRKFLILHPLEQRVNCECP